MSSRERGLVVLGHVACFASGAVASFSLPPFGLAPLILALFWPALAAARAERLSGAALVGAALGFGWFLASMWWVSISLLKGAEQHWFLLPLVFLGIPALLAVFWIPATMLAWRLGREPASRIIWLVAMLGVFEWVRGHIGTGFPWNAPGYFFSAGESLLQAASVFGLYALNLLALCVAVAPALWIVGRRRLAICFAAILPLAAIFGFLRLESINLDAHPGAPVARLVQPSVPQNEKWDPRYRAEHRHVLRVLSRDTGPQPELVIWPEGAAEQVIDPRAGGGEFLRVIAITSLEAGVRLITGVSRFDDQDRAYNSAALVDSEGNIEAIYDKRRLVPFGEFVPFRRLIPFASAIVGDLDFSRGRDAGHFEVPGFGRIQMLICFETLFPDVAAGPGPRPDVLVNISNDAWFGRTPGPWQHLEQARMRAVEEGIPLLRVANTGVTAAFDATGRRLAQIDLDEFGAVDVRLSPALDATIYANWRPLPFVLLLVVLGFVAMRLDRKAAMLH